MESCRLLKVFDLDHARVTAFTGAHEGVKAAGNFQEIVDDPALDLISIASYDDHHYEQVVSVLAAGKSIFVEKPLCRSQAELQAIQRAWIDAGRPWLMSNLVLRGAPLYLWLKEEIRRGTFGKIFAFDGDYLYGRMEKITEGWRGRVADYSVMQGGGIHLVDLMLWLTGEYPESVSAGGNRICTENSGFQYDDFVAATYSFPSGMIARITANFGCVHPHQHSIRLFGTKATFIHDDAGSRIHRGRDRQPAVEPIALAPRPESKSVLIPGLVESILKHAPPDQEVKHEFDLMSACFAADAALKTGGNERVRYLA